MLIGKLGLTISKGFLSHFRPLNNLNKDIYTSKFLFSFQKGSPIIQSDFSEQQLALDKYVKAHRTIQTLQKKGINSFFPIQTKTYNHIYNGRDVIAGDKTGSGKTIAFTLPVIERLRDKQELNKQKGIKFVVLAPTRELAAQIGAQIKSLKYDFEDFRVTTVFGGIPIFVNERQLKQNPDVLVGTPGRIADLYEKGLLNFDHVKVVCIDEADYMFDIGFQQKIDEILANIKGKCQDFQLLCFTATLTQQIVNLTTKYMSKDKVEIKMNRDDSVPTTIEHFGINLYKQNKLLAIKHLIANKSNNGRVIIFTNTKNEATTLSQNLNMRNVLLHGDIEQSKRLQRLKLFKDGTVKVLIATDVAARGLDIPNVQLVINYDLPRNYQNYVHRSGRTGRAGKDGLSIVLSSQPAQTKHFLKNLSKQTTIKIKKMEITSQQYRLAETISQPQPQFGLKQDASEQFINPNELVLFDKRDLLNRNKVKQFLEENGRKFSYIKEIISSKTGNKFYIIRFNQEKQAKETSKLKFLIKNEKGQQIPLYFSFRKQKIQTKVQTKNNQIPFL